MKVKDLIDKLAVFDLELEVVIAGEDQPASEPEYDEKTNTVQI